MPTYSYGIAITGVVAVIGSFFYFWWQAGSTHRVLCEARRELNKRVGIDQGIERSA